MKSVAILLAVLLLSAATAAQTLELKTGKYTVKGESIKQIGEDVQILSDKPTSILWKPGKDDNCRDTCLDASCTCALTMQGLDCVLTSEGICKGVSKTKIALVLNNKEQETVDLDANTKVTYNIISQEFTIDDNEFTFLGRKVKDTSTDPTKKVRIVGNKIVGDSFYYGDTRVSSKNGEQAELTVLPGGFIATKNTITDFLEKGVFVQGKNADYEVCFDSDNCLGETSYVLLDEKKGQLFASGKSDGGPLITLLQGDDIKTPFLRAREDAQIARFSIENLKDSSVRIYRRSDKEIPFMEVKVESEDNFETIGLEERPPLIMRNGRMTFLGFKDDFWLTNGADAVKSAKAGLEKTLMLDGSLLGTKLEDLLLDTERHSSFPMTFTVADTQGKSLLSDKIPAGNVQVLVTSFNEVGLLPKGISETQVDETFMDLAPTTISDTVSYNFGRNANPRFLSRQLKQKFPNLEMEGFSTEDTKKVLDILERLPPALTSQLKHLEYTTREDAKYLYPEDTSTLYGWKENGGRIFLTDIGVGESTLYHELIHIYQEEVADRSPEMRQLKNKYEQLAKERRNLAKKYGKSSTEIADVDIKLLETMRAIDETYITLPIIKEWTSTHTNAEDELGSLPESIRTDMEFDVSEYCSSTVGKDGGWKDGGGLDPKYCVIRPYGCTNIDEDLASYVEIVYRSPWKFAELVKCPPSNCYAEKLNLLKKYGLVDNSRYNVILSYMNPAISNCINAQRIK